VAGHLCTASGQQRSDTGELFVGQRWPLGHNLFDVFGQRLDVQRTASLYEIRVVGPAIARQGGDSGTVMSNRRGYSRHRKASQGQSPLWEAW